MEQPSAPVTQKTGLKISQTIGLALVLLSGVAGGVAILQAGSQLNAAQKTVEPTSTTTTTTTTTVDLTTQETPKAEVYSIPTSPTITTLAGDVSVVVTSPSEGAIINGATPVTVELTDPNRRAVGVRMYIYSDVWPEYFGGRAVLGLDTTAPYTFTPGYALYPSGEFRYEAEAIDANANILATGDKMVTWARTCYYLAYQDMTLNAPTSSVVAGKSFSITGTVKNLQRGNCSHIYNLRTEDIFGPLLPAGWAGSFDPSTLNLGINETRQFTLTIQVPSVTAAATYSVGANSALQYTGFAVTKKVDVTVIRPTTGGGGGPSKSPE